MNFTCAQKLGSLIVTFLALSGCSEKWRDMEKEPISGARLPIMMKETLKIKATGSDPVNLSTPQDNQAWAQSGGTANHAPGHVFLSKIPQKIWDTDIGAAEASDTPIVSGPIIAEDKVFALDADGTVCAVDLNTGEFLWSYDIPSQDSDDGLGGGVAYDQGKVFIASPYAQLICLNAQTGEELWKSDLYSPSRVSPSVKDGRVYVLTISNELQAFNAENGHSLWTHTGIVEMAGILGGGSPAVSDGVVVVAYSSGEVFALKAETGIELWSEGLVPSFQADAISSLAHIRARPIIAGDKVYCVSQSGKISAINLANGQQIWQQPVGGIRTPAIDQHYLFMITNENDLVCFNRLTGEPIWMRSLAKTQDDKAHLWAGPIVAGGQLVITGSDGMIYFYGPDGHLLREIKHGAGIKVSPVVAKGTLIILDQRAVLSAYK